MKASTYTVILLFCSLAMCAQKLRFRLVSEGNPAVNVKVLNIVTEHTAQSDAKGEFVIAVKVDEMLVFPSENYEYKRYLVKEEDFKKTEIVLALVPKPVELDEVVVNRDINPEDLGLVPKGQKQYTPAERRLKQAGEFKPMLLVGQLAGLSIPIDPIINAITGRTKMLKKDLKTEKRERSLAKLNAMYDKAYFTDKLRIPSDKVEGFQYYVVETPEFLAILEAGVKAKTDFSLTGLAQKYNELQRGEK
ncbi:hypothetical protein [Flavobacterium selenitireducens]|uniref:hypothetical protein n=1 Tax=Flavobacterium selenitireducens TaxID=2722704 RepID=UPI00168C05BA|nr:hypothetical protein [Flavobacterium selenitireducens]MBD3583250.1 hypothetical protein [Flavobacterium selenitireducens]